MVTISATVEAALVPWRPLGELFVSRGLISETELETALAEQAATGKRLGEILVDGGLVSGPDLTSALMDQLGLEISKEEGFGSGLWTEIKRRHRRVRQDGEDDDTDGGPPDVAFLVPVEPAVDAPEPEPEVEPEVEPEHEPYAPLPPAAVVDPEFEEDIEEIRAEYLALAPVEPEPELAGHGLAMPELEEVSELTVPEFPVPELGDVSELAESEAAPEPARAAGDDEVARLRAELEEARADVAHLREMLADSMTALAALTAERAGKPYTG